MNNERLQVGIDISQQRLDVSIAGPAGELLVHGQTLANNRLGYEALRQLLQQFQEQQGAAGVDLAAESTGYYWLPLFLHCRQDEAWTAGELALYLQNARQAYWFKKGAAAAEKTDRQDSFFILQKLRTQRAQQHPWAVDPLWLRLRAYSRLRFHLGQALTREKNYFWAHMALFCSSYRTSKPFSDGLSATSRALLRSTEDWAPFAQWPPEQLAQQLAAWSHHSLAQPLANAQRLQRALQTHFPLPPPLRQALHDLLTATLDHIEFLEQQAAQVQRWLHREVATHHPQVNHLLAIKGLGIVLAAGIAAEIGDLSRFFAGQKWDPRRHRYRAKNLRDVEDAVAKGAGLWWPRHESGAFRGQERRLSKQGNRFLRYYLVEAADKLRQYQPEYQAYYQRKYQETKKHQHKRALVLTARKSVGLFVGLLHRQEPYRAQEALGATSP